MNPVKASLKFPQVTLILTAMLVAVGIHALLTMPRREDPKITIRVGLVSAIYPGATAEQVEDQISRRLEQRIFRFEEVRKDKTYSTSRANVAIVYVQLEDSVKDTDKFWAKLRNDLFEFKVRELPSTVQGPVVNSDFGDTVAVLLAIGGGRYDYRALKDYAERIEDELRTLRAVSKLKRFGEQKEQIEISSSLERISQYATNPLRVIGALQARNAIQYAGKIEVGKDAVPLNTSGLFANEEEIRRTLVDVSPTGQPVHLGDIADVHRRYADPTELIRFKGQPSLLLSVEMQEGNNIVEFGKQVRAKLDYLKAQFPPDLNIDLIADQPKVVEDRVSHFIREFGIAIAAVILVTIILLPIRVAVISALAIPVTVAVTFGVMNALSIELHQVSISALIVVLGMVVDDAIVIADNYVELLDRGVARPEAAWRSATELAVPVLTATLTIIASFMPLVMLSGSVGEFISALPIAVAVALASSFIVAMLLTPLLCRFFIRRGLHSPESAGPHKKKFSALDLMQSLYGRTIALGMKYKALAVVVGVAAFVLGVVLLRFVPEQFFPSAERNQFVANVWMPEGTRIEATDAVLRRLEGNLAGSPEVRDYASFTGTSAPRFYYNVNPEPSATNFGQLLVNTRTAEQTPGFVDQLRSRFARLAPEALVMVMELQQGQRMDAPIEVRITGDDLPVLESLGAKVKDVVRDTPGAVFVHTDFHEDSYHLKVDIDTEVANRLGLTNASIAQLLAGAFDGAPISTYWEGDRAVDVVLRLDPAHRDSFGDIRNAYMISTLSSARVPLREVATLRPDWEASRIIRRNGVRTLTVRSFFDRGQLASAVLKRAQPKIAAIPLPAGYRIAYGGEVESQKETFAEMVKALLVSLAIIYLILLFQFRSVLEPVIVMLSIPLSLGGAALGLMITGNPFGFTAFMGVISLSGIVVRNAIILVDYIRERMKEGIGLEEAALEAGQRRLRPIFLTTMAAAVGVTPMILSGSSLWSPLASVIAIGLLFSMFFTLVVVPVIYVLLMRRHTAPVSAVVVLLALFAAGSASAQPRPITLAESVDLALKQNSLLKIARARIREAEGKRQSARANYFPHLANETNYMRLAEPQSLSIPAGLLGNPVPLAIVQGATQFFLTTTTLAQPVTQLIKIRQGDLIARLDIAIATADVARAEHEVVLKVQEAYFGRLIAERQRRSAELRIAAEEEHLRTASDAVEAGVTLEVSRLGRRASLLESRHARLALDNQIADVGEEFNELLGLPLDTQLVLREPEAPPAVTFTMAETVAAGLKENPELRAASLNLAKAQRAVAAARAEYIPEVGVYGQHAYQNGVPFLAKNDGIFGVRMSWDVFDFGKRGGVVRERQALVEQAAENVRRQQRRVALDIQSRYRKLDRARMMVDVAAEALALRREADRLSGDQLTAGVILSGARQDASVALAKAEADYLQAQLGYRLALADLERVVGRAVSAQTIQ